ncbi:histone deacetylase family protein [Poseidonia sp.]|uniref:histone deacetylase family protein n=1 Tax=Poseidonia sp. TaxID=2666344 RepID=UPI003F698F5F
MSGYTVESRDHPPRVNADASNHRLSIWYHPIYTNGIHPEARFPRDRYTKLVDQLNTPGHVDKFIIKQPTEASRNELIMAHDPYYVDNFLNQNLTEKEIKRIGLTPWTPQIIPRTLFLMGGAIAALDHVMQHGGIAGNMAGGTHHAHYDFGSGYCIFNDLAVCSLLALSKYNLTKIAVVDLDVHQGDGTATILQHDDKVLTISVHCQQNFPFRKSQSDYDLELPAHAGDEEVLATVAEALEITKQFDPELILFQAGVDGLATDALGKLNISRQGMSKRNEMVFDLAVERSIPTVVFMGGGYSDPIRHTIDAFSDLFLSASLANQQILSKADTEQLDSEK